MYDCSGQKEAVSTASTPPARPQPLHNFNLPHLKWSNSRDGSQSTPPRHHHHHQRRSSVKSPSRKQLREASLAASVLDLRLTEENSQARVKGTVIEYCRNQPKSPKIPEESDLVGAKRSRNSPIDGARDGIPLSSKIEAKSRRMIEAIRSWDSTIDGVKDRVYEQSGDGLPIKAKSKWPSEAYGEGVRRSKNSLTDGVKSGVFPSSDAKLKATVQSDVVVVKKPRTGAIDGVFGYVGKQKAELEADASGVKKKSTILIKLPCKNSGGEDEDDQLQVEAKNNDDQDDGVNNNNNENDNGDNSNSNNVDEQTKTWNLRPRKPIRKSLTVHTMNNMLPEKNNCSRNNGKIRVTQSPLRIASHKSVENERNCVAVGIEKKDKRKLSVNVQLMKDEIEEDIFVMTGSKPARRPKKRTKIVQKQLDYAFPGLWLMGINADSYKVSESSMKG